MNLAYERDDNSYSSTSSGYGAVSPLRKGLISQEKPGFFRELTGSGGSVQSDGIPPRGAEPNNVNNNEGKGLGQPDSLSAAKSGAFSTDNAATDPGLARVLEAWAKLPDHIRKAILALVETAK